MEAAISKRPFEKRSAKVALADETAKGFPA